MQMDSFLLMQLDDVNVSEVKILRWKTPSNAMFRRLMNAKILYVLRGASRKEKGKDPR